MMRNLQAHLRFENNEVHVMRRGLKRYILEIGDLIAQAKLSTKKIEPKLISELETTKGDAEALLAKIEELL